MPETDGQSQTHNKLIQNPDTLALNVIHEEYKSIQHKCRVFAGIIT